MLGEQRKQKRMKRGWTWRPAKRTTRIAALAWLAVLAFASACTTPYDPFKIPASEVRERVQTIALAPLQVSAGLSDPAATRAKFEPLVAAQLRASGFRVVAADAMESLWQAAAADVGELYDPITGEVNPERFEAVESAVYRDLESKHDVDAVLYTFVLRYDLHLTRRKVNVCGTTDVIYWPETTLGAPNSTTMVRIVCFSARLFDMEERELYAIYSGLETLETFARQTRAIRPKAERLQDPERIRKAVEEALEPLSEAAPKR